MPHPIEDHAFELRSPSVASSLDRVRAWTATQAIRSSNVYIELPDRSFDRSAYEYRDEWDKVRKVLREVGDGGEQQYQVRFGDNHDEKVSSLCKLEGVLR